MIYFDNNATTELCQEALEAIGDYLPKYGNPSSLHSFGESVFQDIQGVRSIIAKQLDCSLDEIIFTSSGTEGNNTCLKGLALSSGQDKNHLITTMIEHPSILETCHFLEDQGCRVTYLPVNAEGFVDPDDLQKAITPATFGISIGHVNSEIGTIQPLEELLAIAGEIPFHTDVVQSFLKTDFKISKYPVTFATFSAHKFHGPKGIGFIYKKRDFPFLQHLHGGSQEMGWRAGTENVLGIIGLGAALSCYQASSIERMRLLQKELVTRLQKEFDIKLNGPSNLARRVCTNVNVSFPTHEGEELLKLLSAEEIYVSTGSACSSRSKRISPVLQAICCHPKYIHGNVRFGLSKFTTLEEIEQLLFTLRGIMQGSSCFSLSIC